MQNLYPTQMDAASARDAAASEDVGPPPYNHKPVLTSVIAEGNSAEPLEDDALPEPESPSQLLRAALALVRSASPEEQDTSTHGKAEEVILVEEPETARNEIPVEFKVEEGEATPVALVEESALDVSAVEATMQMEKLAE